jgi:hypothetical protein
MNKRALTAGVIVCGMVSSNAVAMVFGGSNLDFLGYPSHTCTAPYSKPIKPYSFSSQWEVDQYNMEVENYNRERREFISCIEEYVDNEKNDIKRIKEKANEAINEANSQ